MKTKLIVKNPYQLNIVDGGENVTNIYVRPASHYSIMKGSIDPYRKEARKILDKLSKEYNSLGIDGIMAALIIETIGEDYYGNTNEKRG